MTREEITEKLKSLKADIVSCGGCEGKKDYAQALTETIEALQTEPCEDAISRQAAIDALDKGAWGVEWDKALAKAMLENLPSVTAERKPAWTPVKTRPLTDEERDGLLIDAECAFDCPMPEDGQEVIVTTDLGGVGIDTFCRDIEGCYFENYDDDVIAWMPVPEPWEEDEE